jgi:hypothetical protein
MLRVLEKRRAYLEQVIAVRGDQRGFATAEHDALAWVLAVVEDVPDLRQDLDEARQLVAARPPTAKPL